MLEEVAKDAWEYGRKFLLQGKVADYIPELGKANPVHFGLCIKTEDGRHIEFGDSECRFTIQLSPLPARTSARASTTTLTG